MPVTASDPRDALCVEGRRQAADITRRRDPAYYWGTAVLPAGQRADIRTIYAFCRTQDDLVDGHGSAHLSVDERRRRLEQHREDLLATVAGASDDAEPLVAAMADVVSRHPVDAHVFDRFFAAMASDLTVRSFAAWDDLLVYMDGAAVAIGDMMLPVLAPDPDSVRDAMRAMSLAFQLTNIVRDVGQDLDRGLVHLPTEHLERFGVDLTRRIVDEPFRDLMRFEIAQCRRWYAEASGPIAALPPRAARCLATSMNGYAAALDALERADYDVFGPRVRISKPRKLAVTLTTLASPALARALHFDAGGLR